MEGLCYTVGPEKLLTLLKENRGRIQARCEMKQEKLIAEKLITVVKIFTSTEHHIQDVIVG